MPPQENPPSDPIAQIVNSLKSANNVLITVSANPSVDQLAACIGLTLAINKLGKHGTAVFSGRAPSTLEFLKPEDTLEKNTDSLRDFIISLDKSKADKLRYKVEDNVVKIFITPYRTSISDKDLEFTQGDFNVDAVIALGVHERTDLDAAIMAHGRILHTATIVSLNTTARSELGSINWLDPKASSLCEMTVDLITQMDDKLIDAQIATALLTGMVAETDRFGNDKASPHTMSVSGTLMAAGASPQLIASKLDEPVAPAAEIPEVVEASKAPAENPDGTIEIDHTAPPAPLQPAVKVEEKPPEDEIHIDDQGKLHNVRDFRDHGLKPKVDGPTAGRMTEPPSFSGQLTASTESEGQQYSETSDPLSRTTPQGHLLGRDTLVAQPQPPSEPPSEPPVSVSDDQTLSEIEETIHKQHPDSSEPVKDAQQPAAADVPDLPVEELSKAAQQVAEQADERPHPLEAIRATGDLNLDHAVESPVPPLPAEPAQAPPEVTAENPPAVEQKPPDNAPPPVPPPFVPNPPSQ